MRWLGHVTRWEVMINVCHILAMKLHVKRPLERLRRKERKILFKWIVKEYCGRV
jgi:hypothetical protein